MGRFNMKKIKMILTNRYDPDVRVHKEARYLVSKGFDVEILCWDRENEYRDKETEHIEGIRIRRFFPYARYGTGLKQVKAFLRFIIQVRKYLSSQEYDYIHCHDLDGVLVGYIARTNKSDIIFDMHEFYEVQGKKQKIRYVIRFIVDYLQSKSKYIIYVNEFQATVMKDSNKKKLIYLPNYPEHRNYLKKEKTTSDYLRISYIGAVRQYNELKNLMDACKELDGVKVSIHGAGVAYERLNAIQDDYKNVNVTGRYHFTDSSSLFREADILYALYSTTSMQYRTSYPVKLYEAILTKTPLIVNKGTVLEEFVIKHDIGFAIDGDILSIKNLVQEIIKDNEILKKKTRNIEAIQYDFNWEYVVVNLDNIYQL